MNFAGMSDKMRVKIFNYILIIEKKENFSNTLSIEDYTPEKMKEKANMEKEKVYNVLDVARYVVEYCIEKETPISQIHLQKIIYYIQAAFLVELRKKCFNEKILNWAYGPVVREVYDEFRDFGSNKINKVPSIVSVTVDDDFNFIYDYKQYNSSNIKKEDKDLIRKIVDIYSVIPPFELVEKTHDEDPWYFSERNSEILTRSMQKYYCGHKDKLYGEK